MFGSNVQPRVKKKARPTEWECLRCSIPVRFFHNKCPECRTPRNQ